jgi:RNA polymerase sigma-32 factor
MIYQFLETERTRPLSAEEQMRLACAYRRTKDPLLEKRLVETSLRLVAKIAHQLDHTNGRSLEDLFQEGCLGLVEAIRRFDPARGARLSTYATLWIRAFIFKYAMNNVREVRVVRTRAERAAFFQGRIGSTEISLDAPASPDGAPLGDFIADPIAPVDRQVETAELAHLARKSAAKLEGHLNSRDRMILKERLLTEEPTPLRALAERVSLSGERVGQIEGELRAAIRCDLEPSHRLAA